MNLKLLILEFKTFKYNYDTQKKKRIYILVGIILYTFNFFN